MPARTKYVEDDKTATANNSPTDESVAGAPKQDEAKEAGADDKAKADDKKAEELSPAEKEKKRKEDEYNDKVKKGQQHVKELNDRFADWYYVVSDEVYHKIHLKGSDVIKTKEKPAGKGDGATDFNELEKGLPGVPKPPAAK